MPLLASEVDKVGEVFLKVDRSVKESLSSNMIETTPSINDKAKQLMGRALPVGHTENYEKNVSLNDQPIKQTQLASLQACNSKWPNEIENPMGHRWKHKAQAKKAN